LIKAGGTYTTPASTFQNAGTYNYFCMVHPWMTGQIIVAVSSVTPPGNQTVPEFGPIASLVLVFAVVGVVIMSARTRGFLKL
jgi:hypothetical protein